MSIRWINVSAVSCPIVILSKIGFKRAVETGVLLKKYIITICKNNKGKIQFNEINLNLLKLYPIPNPKKQEIKLIFFKKLKK